MTQIRGEQVKYTVIGEVSSDPVSPVPGQTWMLAKSRVGQPVGLLLALTYASRVDYQLSYKTATNGIIRTSLG